MSKLKQVVIYIIGIFLFAMGVAFAIKSNLGVSPVSTLPYVSSILLGHTVGTMTAILYIVFILAQWLILGSEFDKVNLFQLVFAFAFGFCVDLSRILIMNIPNTNIWLQITYLIVGTLIIGFGIFLILKSGWIVSPTDGLVKAIAKKFSLQFSKVKIGVDLGTAIISAILSFVFLGELIGVGVGTIISAFGVGMSISFYEKIMGHYFRFNNAKEVR